MNNTEFKQAIWKILQEECGAGEDTYGFATHSEPISEWRFQGNLGFGGKIRFRDGVPYVDCYPEDETILRRIRIAEANTRLLTLYVKAINKS